MEKKGRKKPDPENSKIQGSFGSGERRGERRKDHFLGKNPTGMKGSADLKKRLSLLDEIEQESGFRKHSDSHFYAGKGKGYAGAKPHHFSGKPNFSGKSGDGKFAPKPASKWNHAKPTDEKFSKTARSDWKGEKSYSRPNSKPSDKASARHSNETREIRPSRRGMGRNLGGTKKW
jgi:hypothetical protein